ncbi:unnamed protein product [Owenia fusiformis]|uniref:IST1 homolog n=1 Tax=Owenia fusiformis TaxID=6347 RepID=A0A8J1XJE4_OWEFU|nr:unnamed protein product [Owenia fusiformis]
MFSSGPNYSKLRTNLRLSINRLKLLEKKKTEMGEKARKEIVNYITSNKIDRARIRVEHIVREDYLVEAMEILEMYCDLLLARMGLIENQKDLDPGLEEAIATIIWITPRLISDVAELKTVTEQLTSKYSKEFADACRKNELSNVNQRIIQKMSVEAPPKLLIEKYLIEIARTYNAAFEPDPTIMKEDEIYMAENQLMNFDNATNNARSGGGGGSNEAPVPNAAFNYPPAQAQGGYPPPQNHAPPFTMPAVPPGMPPPPAVVHPPPQSMNYNNPGYPPQNQTKNPNAAQDFPELPDLPAVPGSDPGSSMSQGAGNESVDFDDLTKRFEELKKKK